MNFRIRIPNRILQLHPYQPGPAIQIPGIVNMASNENSFGPSPLAIQAILRQTSAVHRYPEDSGTLLRNALAARIGVTTDQIVLGQGSTELIQICAQAILEPGDNAVTASNTFIVYRMATLLAGATCKEAPLRDFRYDVEGLHDSIDERTRIVFIANPNNPTGTFLNDSELQTLLNMMPSNVLVVLDEAYFHYVEDDDYPNALRYLDEFDNLLVLRTFSKIYGLAGLRIGYAIGNRELIQNLNRVRLPFNTSNVAQAAAVAALEDEDHVRVSRESMLEERNFLEEELLEANVPFVSSVGNFLFLPLGNGGKLQHSLLQKGIFVRLVKDGLRVTVGTHDENLEFLNALNESL